MNRLVLLTLGGLVSIATMAQQPAPEGANNNRNSPVVNSPATSPSATAPNASTTPGSTPSPKPSGATNPSVANQGPTSANPPGATGQPSQPTTEMLPEGANLPSADPVLEPKELPRKDMSLVGGTAVKVDKIRNRVEIQPFGGGRKWNVRFDDRSHIYRDGRETTVMTINKGDRIYADTMLVDGHVFARNLRVVSKSGPAESRGQVTSFDSKTGRVILRDSLTGQAVTFFVSQQTAMNKRGGPASTADLRPGALLEVMFAPEKHGGTADQVSVLASPGEDFIFSGKVTNLDLSRGVLSVDNESDGKNYEVHFNPENLDDRNALRIGKDITARAQFDGRSYRANQVTVMRSTSAEQ